MADLHIPRQELDRVEGSDSKATRIEMKLSAFGLYTGEAWRERNELICQEGEFGILQEVGHSK